MKDVIEALESAQAQLEKGYAETEVSCDFLAEAFEMLESLAAAREEVYGELAENAEKRLGEIADAKYQIECEIAELESLLELCREL